MTPAERERLWRMMESDLDELDGLIDSSLTYARFEREQPELQLTAVEIGPWLEEQVEAAACWRASSTCRSIPRLAAAAARRTRSPEHALRDDQPPAQRHQVRQDFASG
jgi:hypothetical protein